MGVYNQLETSIACPYCETEFVALADFRFGIVGGCLYRIGDTIRWGTDADETPIDYMGEGWVICKGCRRDFWIRIYIETNKFVRCEIDHSRDGFAPRPIPEKPKSYDDENALDSLIKQLRSSDVKGLKSAVETLRAKNWLVDGSLRGIDLSNVGWSQIDLRHADLQGARLIGAELKQCDLYWVNLKWADLGSAILSECFLTGSNLRRANLVDAQLQSARLSNVVFRGSRMDRCNLSQSDLNYADLSHCSLESAIFDEAFILGVNLMNANLTNASFHNVRLPLPVDLFSQAYELRGAIMPDHSRYDGRFNLTGDLQAAQNEDFDTSNPKDMAGFYDVPVDAYNEGQLKKADTD